MIRVLIGEDFDPLRDAIRALAERAGGIEIVGEASSTDETLQLVQELTPDVVVLNDYMPSMRSTEAVKFICGLDATIRVLMISMHPDVPQARKALENGASGYLLKDELLTELVNAIHTVYQGEIYLSGRVAAAAPD